MSILSFSFVFVFEKHSTNKSHHNHIVGKGHEPRQEESTSLKVVLTQRNVCVVLFFLCIPLNTGNASRRVS